MKPQLSSCLVSPEPATDYVSCITKQQLTVLASRFFGLNYRATDCNMMLLLSVPHAKSQNPCGPVPGSTTCEHKVWKSKSHNSSYSSFQHLWPEGIGAPPSRARARNVSHQQPDNLKDKWPKSAFARIESPQRKQKESGPLSAQALRAIMTLCTTFLLTSPCALSHWISW